MQQHPTGFVASVRNLIVISEWSTRSRRREGTRKGVGHATPCARSTRSPRRMHRARPRRHLRATGRGVNRITRLFIAPPSLPRPAPSVGHVTPSLLFRIAAPRTTRQAKIQCWKRTNEPNPMRTRTHARGAGTLRRLPRVPVLGRVIDARIYLRSPDNFLGDIIIVVLVVVVVEVL